MTCGVFSKCRADIGVGPPDMKDQTFTPESGNDELWSLIFSDGHPALTKQHRVHTMLPRDPRCRLCLVPFHGIGGWLMKLKGKRPSARNNHYCNACDGFLDTFPGGADVEMSMLFVDIRNSVDTASQIPPADVAKRINAFLTTATKVITDHDGFIMAFYGDCVVAVWPPGFVGSDHAQKALSAARDLTQIGQITAPDGSTIPIGVGVHVGDVHIATVQAGQGLFRDISVFGQNVNLTARLAGLARSGEVLASAELAAQARFVGGEASEYALKGFDAAVPTISIRA